ncbi:MAG: esterase family protein [Bifidobacteriaceae bacterium]|jgi:S-formylglutathione hydrolase FrmB|nr:esterase family protein [Bifidobacteriaceae bacterium]
MATFLHCLPAADPSAQLNCSTAPLAAPDLLASLPFGIGLAVFGLLLLVVAAVWLLRKKHRTIRARRTWRSLAFTFGGFALVLGLALSANWYAGWIPNWNAAKIKLGLGDSSRADSRVAKKAPPTDQMGTEPIASDGTPVATAAPISKDKNGQLPHGATKEFVLPGTEKLALAKNSVWVYTPPDYDPSGKTAYPVIYLMHGAPGGPEDWIGSGAPDVLDQMILAGKLAPVVAVAPAVMARADADSGCLDSTKPGGSQIETFLFEVVKPWTENHFPVSTDRSANAISGMSMGGYCAIDQGLRHKDQFATVLSIMPYGSPGKAGDTMKSNQAEIDAVTPLKYIAALEGFDQDPLAIWFAVPGGDVGHEVGNDAEAMAKELRALGQTVDLYIDKDQTHTWKGAIHALPVGLAFWQKQLGKLGPGNATAAPSS